MKMRLTTPSKRQRLGSTLVDALVGILGVGMVCGAVLSGLTSGTFTMRMARENLRATQILLEKAETIRLYNWDQINSNGFIPTNFTVAYDPNSTNSGCTYTGTFTLTKPTFNATYTNDLRLLTVQVSWKSGGLQRSRSFRTYISHYGIQDYIY
jgi:type II secretory pathway pseudopilin PulG